MGKRFGYPVGTGLEAPLGFFRVMLALPKHLLVMIVMVASIRLSASRWYPLVRWFLFVVMRLVLGDKVTEGL